jgi:cellulose synthase/poly-beta-1,6-N-acetylglucosamine synthase-like glycosyltransferase
VEFLFWVSVVIIGYVYAGYPGALAIVARFRPQRPLPAAGDDPAVTLIISAYNEAPVIGQKLDNALDLDYPGDRFEIIVVSDCSSDGTDDIVSSVQDPRVRLLRMPVRSGKSAGLNAAVALACGEVLVFTDANAMFERTALRMLTHHFAQPAVGAVAGQQLYYLADGGQSDQEGVYWRYELAIKKLESRVGSLVGGDGAIMAVRKSLYQPLDASDLSDFLIPLRVVAAGFVNVYEPQARCYEHATADTDKEFARKVRIVNRAWRATMKVKSVLNPFRSGWFALQVISHKLLRWLIGLFMAVALIANALLIGESWFYTVTFAVQAAFYVLAMLGRVAGPTQAPWWLSIPYYFCLINYAGIKGIYENYRGETYTTWATARQPEA